MAKRKRIKRLNIYNTDKHFNFNLLEKEEIQKKIKVTRINEDEIQKELLEFKNKPSRFKLRDKNSYLIFQEKYTNDNIINDVINHGGSVTYYTDTTLPYYILKQLSTNTNSEVVYSIRPKFSPREIENIETSFMGTTVVIDIPIVIPDINPYDLLFALHPLKTNVDRVQLSFPTLTKKEVKTRHEAYYHQIGEHWEVKPECKYSYFKYLQNSLSIWGMNIWIVSDSKEDREELQKLADKEFKPRSLGGSSNEKNI